MIDPQIFIDRMLEVENLTDNLVDEDAEYLINWGVARLKERLGKIDELPSAGKFTNDLMGFMRLLNQIAGNLETLQPDDLVELGERSKKAFGPSRELAAEDYRKAAGQLKTMKPRQAIDSLIQLLIP